MSDNCSCIYFTFVCSNDDLFTINLYRTLDLYNGKPRYIGLYESKEYEIYYNGVVGSYWVFRETDPVYTTPIYESTLDTSFFCETSVSDWVENDTSNFKYCIDGEESPISIYDLGGDDFCIPNPSYDSCDDSSCYYFSGESSYLIRYSTNSGDIINFRLTSGGTASFCSKGTPVIFPIYYPDLYSAQTSTQCVTDCVPTGYCECLTFLLFGTRDYGFFVGGTQNSKTFWLANYDDENFKIYWNGEKWLLVKIPNDYFDDEIVLAESDFSGVCPPTGSSVDNWTIFDSSYDDFTIETYDCYPDFTTSKSCWRITASTDNEEVIFYDDMSLPPKKVILPTEGDVMEVCAYSKPICSNSEDCSVVTSGSCYTICDSVDLCGCIKLQITCRQEGGGSPQVTIPLIPSGTINGKPFYVNGDNVLFFSTYWFYINTLTNTVLSYSRSEDDCPFSGNWIDEDSEICDCIGGYGFPELVVLPKICPQLPTPTPTPTPVPVPYVTPMRNECVPTALFDMFTICQPTNPTSPSSPDGSITLLVSGGTGPYNIVWSNGNIGPSIYNLMEGSYTATTTDYYGDFTSTTICELVATQPTTTTTTTTEPPIDEYTLCMTISTIQSTGTTTESITFQPNGMFNGKPSWISTNGDSLIWNNVSSQWNVIFDPTRTYYVLSLDSSYPPLYNWIVVGLSGSVSVVEGECSIMEPMMMRKKTTSFKSLMIDGSNLGGFSN